MIRYGTNPIAWSNDDDPSLGGHISLEQCLSDAGTIGFDGIEKGNKFPTDPLELMAKLAEYNLVYVSGWHSLNLLVNSVDEEQAAIQSHIDTLKANSCTVAIVCETSNTVHGNDGIALSDRPTLKDDEWDGFCASVEAIAEYCSSQDITLAYHPHMGTIVQSEEEIDRLMSGTGPHTHLLLDTGHVYFADGNPEAVAARHVGRIAHVHTKNLRADIKNQVVNENLSFLEGVRRGVFTVPGDPEGVVDFPPVLSILSDNKYSGWLVIEAEQDPDQRNPFEYQSLGLKTLKAMAADAGLE